MAIWTVIHPEGMEYVFEADGASEDTDGNLHFYNNYKDEDKRSPGLPGHLVAIYKRDWFILYQQDVLRDVFEKGN